VLCSRCIIAHNNAVTRHFFKRLAISGVLLAGSLSLLSKSAMPWETAIGLALMVTFLPFGWSALTRYFPPGHHYFHPAARFMALSTHLFVAGLLGWLVGPWQIYKAVREIIKARSVNLSLNEQ
jgi:Mn2+/Fe2+ NRAMP family transporter